MTLCPRQREKGVYIHQNLRILRRLRRWRTLEDEKQKELERRDVHRAKTEKTQKTNFDIKRSSTRIGKLDRLLHVFDHRRRGPFQMDPNLCKTSPWKESSFRTKNRDETRARSKNECIRQGHRIVCTKWIAPKRCLIRSY